jgi:Flp pilus assembly protein TadB
MSDEGQPVDPLDAAADRARVEEALLESGSSGQDQDVARAARSRRTASVLEALSAVESRLDPAPGKRGQRIADLVTLLVLAVVVLVYGFPIERPLLLVALLVLGTGATRVIRHLRSHRLRQERDRLLRELDGPRLISDVASPRKAPDGPG